MPPQTSVPDPPSPMVAVLDRDGTIVWVNEAWQRFGRVNGVPSEDHSVDRNYLAMTRQADYDRASYIASEIRDVLRNDRQPFTAVYPCQIDDRDDWFQVYATGATIDGDRHGLVLHRQVTPRNAGDGEATASTDPELANSPHRGPNRLVTYTIAPNETATDALLAGFEAVGVDPMQRETTLYDDMAADAVDRLFTEGSAFRLVFPVWGHRVVLTADALTIYATDEE